VIDNIEDIAAFYNSDPTREHLRLTDRQLEYDLTWRYLNDYLPVEGRILEIGAATGRYTLALAQRGYTITAVDLSADLLDVGRKAIVEAGFASQVQFIVADVRDLNAVTEREFDAVLLMGPLYHLIVEADRKLALQQVFDLLRGGGLIFSAFLSRLGILGDLLKKNPCWIENQAEVQAMLVQGHRPDDAPRGGFRGYLAQTVEIAPLHEAIGFETVVLAGIEPAISADDASYNQLQGQQRQQWLDLFYAISRNLTILGASRHLLYVGKKE
jgi:S-adenosylmethionine-dependent methyltransferase